MRVDAFSCSARVAAPFRSMRRARDLAVLACHCVVPAHTVYPTPRRVARKSSGTPREPRVLRKRFTFTVSVLSSMKASDSHRAHMISLRGTTTPGLRMSVCRMRSSLRVSSAVRPWNSTVPAPMFNVTPLWRIVIPAAGLALRRSNACRCASSTAGR